MICGYIDRLVSIVRPRRLLYLAVDGCAPRAKMNQQRMRRFIAGDERQRGVDDAMSRRSELEARGRVVHARPSAFDSNSITPGTSFLSRLSVALELYIQRRIAADDNWAKLVVCMFLYSAQ